MVPVHASRAEPRERTTMAAASRSAFAFNPNISPPPTTAAPATTAAPPQPVPDLGLLAGMVGSWSGTGFNTIWRPMQDAAGQDRFLELNRTLETLDFTPIAGAIPNRGLLQSDIFMAGLQYLQTVADADQPPPTNGLHLEPGVWLNVPATGNPDVPPTVVRMSSIPHGTALVAQGTAGQHAGQPDISAVDINPFPTGNPAGARPFPEQDLSIPTAFRTPDVAAHGITQPMIDNPSSVLVEALHQLDVTTTITLTLTTSNTPVVGGGTVNTAFLAGEASGPNADATLMESTFWLMSVGGSADFTVLQYRQRVLLQFNNLIWPHVSVATLTKQLPA
jgi:hypothetical protein